MTSNELSAFEADAIANAAISHFNSAAAIYTQIAAMATWTPAYDRLSCQAQAHMAAGRAEHARYTAWRDRTALRARIDAVLADSDPRWVAEAERNEAGKCQ